MAIKASGSLSFTEITAEFPSNINIGTTPDSLSEFDKMIVSRLNRTTGRYTQYVIPENPSFSNFYNVDWGFEIDIFVVGGGGSGGTISASGVRNVAGGGGGGGGVTRVNNLYITPGTNYSLTVGGAGLAPANQLIGLRGNNGKDSTFTYIRPNGTTVNYVGSGGGGGGGANNVNGANGGCGGGGCGANSFGVGGTGTQGRNGGSSILVGALSREGGGGGGSTGQGANGQVGAATNGAGGAGTDLTNFMGTAASAIPTGVAGGGGAGFALSGNSSFQPPGANGGGNGTNALGSLDAGRNGDRRTGGGGGGGSKFEANQEGAGDGGSGVIIVRYRGQYRRDNSSGNNVVYTTGTVDGIDYQFVIFGRRALDYNDLKGNDFNEVFSVPSAPQYAP